MAFADKMKSPTEDSCRLWGVIEISVPGSMMFIPPQDLFLMLYVHSGTGELKQGGTCWHIESGHLLQFRFGFSYRINALESPVVFTAFLLSGDCRRQPFISRITHGSVPDHQIEEFARYGSRTAPGTVVPQFETFFDSFYGGCREAYSLRFCPAQISALKQILDDRYAEQLRLEQIADELHLNKYRLIKDFKACYGLPPIEYLIDHRIQQACRFLRETDKSIAMVGMEVGVENTAYFIRIFKKKIGCTPFVYRKHFQYINGQRIRERKSV